MTSGLEPSQAQSGHAFRLRLADKFTLQLHGITLTWVNMEIEFAII